MFLSVISAQSTDVPLRVGDSLTDTALKTPILNCALVEHKCISIANKEQAIEEILKQKVLLCDVRLQQGRTHFFFGCFVDRYIYIFSPLWHKNSREQSILSHDSVI